MFLLRDQNGCLNCASPSDQYVAMKIDVQPIRREIKDGEKQLIPLAVFCVDVK